MAKCSEAFWRKSHVAVKMVVNTKLKYRVKTANTYMVKKKNVLMLWSIIFIPRSRTVSFSCRINRICFLFYYYNVSQRLFLENSRTVFGLLSLIGLLHCILFTKEVFLGTTLSSENKMYQTVFCAHTFKTTTKGKKLDEKDYKSYNYGWKL